MKGKNYKMKVRPAIMYGLKMVANKKKTGEVELKMLRLPLAVTRLDQIRNEFIGDSKNERFGDSYRGKGEVVLICSEKGEWI